MREAMPTSGRLAVDVTIDVGKNLIFYSPPGASEVRSEMLFFWNFPVIYLINGAKFFSETYLVKYFYDISLQLIEDN